MVASFQKAQQPIIFTRHTNKTSLIYESALWTLDATLDCPEESLIFDKRRSNIFDEPGFEKLLWKLDMQELYICGFVTNGCVQAACLKGQAKGYRICLLKDAYSTFVKNANHVIESWNAKLIKSGITVIPADEAKRQL